MNMVDLMWLFCGAFIGGLITLFFMSMFNISRDKIELERANRKIFALEEDKKVLKKALAKLQEVNTIKNYDENKPSTIVIK